MSDRSEKEFLSSVLTHLDEKNPPATKRWWSLLPSLFLWLGAFVVFLLYMSLGGQPHWTHALVTLSALGLGHYWSYRMYLASFKRHWPLLAPHVDRSSIEARLNELGA